jgi:hypothetical protein
MMGAPMTGEANPAISVALEEPMKSLREYLDPMSDSVSDGYPFDIATNYLDLNRLPESMAA